MRNSPTWLMYLTELSSRASCVSPEPPAAPEYPITEKAYEPPSGSYLSTLSNSSPFCLPMVRVPYTGELTPPYAAPWNGCPARLESPCVVRLANGTPLFCVIALSASDRLADSGLKPVSSLKMPAHPSKNSRVPLRPIFDWLNPFSDRDEIDLLFDG